MNRDELDLLDHTDDQEVDEDEEEVDQAMSVVAGLLAEARDYLEVHADTKDGVKLLGKIELALDQYFVEDSGDSDPEDDDEDDSESDDG